MAAASAAEITPLGRPKVLLDKISRTAAPPTRKECIMSAQRGDRRVIASTWTPTVLPRRTIATERDEFVLVKAKLMGEYAIQDDYFLAVSSTPKKFFEAAMKDLTSRDRKEREIAFATIHVLASEGSHELTPECKYFVGECCFFGRGTRKDLERATRWFQSVLPHVWPQGLLPTPSNAMAHSQFLLGEAFEFGNHPSLKPDIQKAVTWYSRSALRGHIVAALSMGEILAQSGGTAPRPKGVNFEQFGANQARRISQGGGAVGVKREGWRLGYYTDTVNSHNEVYIRARQFFKDVIELCSEATDRETLKWDMRVSDWDKGSNTPCVNRRTTSPDSVFGGRREGDDADNLTSSTNSGVGTGSPKDWPVLRCRAFLGLAILDQEGQGQTANMPRAVRLLQTALDTVGDRHAISLLRPPQHLKESFPRNSIMMLPQKNSKLTKERRRISNNTSSKRQGSSDFQVVQFPSLESSNGVRRRFIAGSTVIVFNLALCYHFGRGVEQDLNAAFRLYKEFHYRGLYSVDPVAQHPLWAKLAEELTKHCESLLRLQQQHISRAALLLEG